MNYHRQSSGLTKMIFLAQENFKSHFLQITATRIEANGMKSFKFRSNFQSSTEQRMLFLTFCRLQSFMVLTE